MANLLVLPSSFFAPKSFINCFPPRLLLCTQSIVWPDPFASPLSPIILSSLLFPGKVNTVTEHLTSPAPCQTYSRVVSTPPSPLLPKFPRSERVGAIRIAPDLEPRKSF
ncbi:hypothetical protein M501DRAFT_997465 [Patellaria atrata CBS 101060]|uniref:Uncharacterized protein n=1 Tax=Patellaria atrata CBS 101060 TaxID=1346257 RepID=A0A9P4S3X1_9PEZI|nr:hypothetical protein M501DRAFT_997465 [Patellaria atrata CBS 101060]